MDFPAREKAAVFASRQPWALRSPEPQCCAVGKGHELHAGAESKAKPPLHKAHLHRCQCRVPGQCSPTRGGEAAEKLEKPQGTVEGDTQGCRGAAA